MNAGLPPQRDPDAKVRHSINQFHVCATGQDITTRASRERIATAALQGLLAATPNATQSAVSADAYASRAVRYADALLEALNRATPEASHARKR